eukprot:m.96640 g.96640  ORF g.96640 m.96640 type:complete len:367 (+) comp13553_c0_seq2:162-1262(+)
MDLDGFGGFHDVNDDEYWLKPPEPSKGKKELEVDCQIIFYYVGNIDTRMEQFEFSSILFFYWNDPRLIGWDENADLPPKLWGPRASNSKLEFLQRGMQLWDSKTGRMKRTFDCFGTLQQNFNLLDFPFDHNVLNVQLHARGHFLSLDQTVVGNFDRKWLYSIKFLEDASMGDAVKIGIAKSPTGFQFRGVLAKVDTSRENQGKYTILNNWTYGFLINRKPNYYMWKAIFPIYAVVLAAFSAFAIEADDVGSRLGIVSTYFLSTFAVLYVVTSGLPETDFLTCVDYIIISAIFSFLPLTLAVCLGDFYDPYTDYAAFVFFGLIVLLQFFILVPYYRRYVAKNKMYDDPAKMLQENPGQKYFPWKPKK